MPDFIKPKQKLPSQSLKTFFTGKNQNISVVLDLKIIVRWITKKSFKSKTQPQIKALRLHSFIGTLFNGVGFQRFSRSYFDDK